MEFRSISTESAGLDRVWPLRHVRDEPLRFLQTLAARGDVVPFTIGRRKAFLLCHPTDIEQVLVSDYDRFAKGPAFARAKRLLGDGLLTAEGDVHRRLRQIVQPAFHRAPMHRYGELMVLRAAELRDQWRTSPTVDLTREMQRLTLAIVVKALFGEEFDDRQADEVRSAIAAIASQDPLVSLLAPFRRTGPERKGLQSIVRALVERRVRSGQNGDDLLGLLLATDRTGPTSAKQLQDDVLTMLVAGHDTIANALTWTWLLLAGHPQVEDTLHRELSDVLGGRLPTSSDLEYLTYTRAVLAECLRLFPAAWIVTRVALQDCELDTATIPAGSLVAMSQYLVHRDARFFDEPLRFDPTRWMPPRRGSRPKLAYFPFGAGPRSCIGEGFAWMEGMLSLAVLAQHWRVRPTASEGVVTETGVTLRPKPPVLARLEPRR